MKIGFIGIGKLGKDVAEVMSENHDVVGYDINKVDTTLSITNNLSEAVKGKDFVFVAVPTPHDQDYDGKYPTSHLKPKDFDYEILINVTKEISELVDQKTLIILISTVLPGTIRKQIMPILKGKRFIYNPNTYAIYIKHSQTQITDIYSETKPQAIEIIKSNLKFTYRYKEFLDIKKFILIFNHLFHISFRFLIIYKLKTFIKNISK